MKINVTLTIDINPDQYAEYNGINKSDVREDVRDHVLHMVQEGSQTLKDADAEVSLKR